MIEQAYIIDEYGNRGTLTPNHDTLDVVISKHGDRLAIPYEAIEKYLNERKEK